MHPIKLNILTEDLFYWRLKDTKQQEIHMNICQQAINQHHT